VEATLDELCKNAHFKGIRPMIHDIPDVDWMLKESLKKGFQAVIERDLTFDCLVRPIHLKNLHRLLTTLPDLRAIIDHCAKPDIAGNGFQAWARDIKNLAQDTTAYCKLSGLITEAGPGWKPDHLQPYIDHIITCFGPERIIWGSDWPVLTLNSTYDDWYATANVMLAGLKKSAQNRIFGMNAVDFYHLS
jgi:L-fuconolactonase